ncbi:MAG: hypothetical protein ACXV5Q_15370 [Frankiaceae bacterium]
MTTPPAIAKTAVLGAATLILVISTATITNAGTVHRSGPAPHAFTKRQRQRQIRAHVRGQLAVRAFFTHPAHRDRGIDLLPRHLRDQHPERDLIRAHNRTIHPIRRHGRRSKRPQTRRSRRHADDPHPDLPSRSA